MEMMLEMKTLSSSTMDRILIYHQRSQKARKMRISRELTTLTQSSRITMKKSELLTKQMFPKLRAKSSCTERKSRQRKQQKRQQRHPKNKAKREK